MKRTYQILEGNIEQILTEDDREKIREALAEELGIHAEFIRDTQGSPSHRGLDGEDEMDCTRIIEHILGV